jgi:hypothetical protein
VFFEAMKKTDIVKPIPAGQMKQKSDSTMKSGEMVYLVYSVCLVEGLLNLTSK